MKKIIIIIAVLLHHAGAIYFFATRFGGKLADRIVYDRMLAVSFLGMLGVLLVT